MTHTINTLNEMSRERFNEFYAEKLREIYELSISGAKVFSYMFSALKENREYVKVDMSECLLFTKIKTRQTIYRCLSELVSKGIISKSDEAGVYGVNTSIFFTDNEVTFTYTTKIIPCSGSINVVPDNLDV